MPQEIEKKLRAELAEIGDDHTFGLEMGAVATMAIIQALQLAVRHPGFTGAARDMAMEAANSLANQVGGPGRPTIDYLIQRGWTPNAPDFIQ